MNDLERHERLKRLERLKNPTNPPPPRPPAEKTSTPKALKVGIVAAVLITLIVAGYLVYEFNQRFSILTSGQDSDSRP